MSDVQKKPCSVAIIGGGAAGLAAAVTAARHLLSSGKTSFNENGCAEKRSYHDYPIIILEGQDRVGKKILATGNGRCNLSHMPLDLSAYHGTHQSFAYPSLNRLSQEKTIAWFRTLGLPCQTDPEGRVFPRSGQASAVVDLFRRALDTLPVAVKTQCKIASIKKRGSKFSLVSINGEVIEAETVLVACGGLAAPAFGCDGSGYTLLKQLGHRLVPPFPALVQLRTQRTNLRGLSGVRLIGTAELRKNKTVIRREEGEILFTDYGLSGPPVLQLARHVYPGLTGPADEPLKVFLDCLPDMTHNQIAAWLQERILRDPQCPLKHLLTGLLHKRVGLAAIKAVTGLPPERPVIQLGDGQLHQLAGWIKNWAFIVTGTLGWSQAQVTAGGIDVRDFNPETLESRKISGLFAAGEILDIDGDCGGYNLQWAWSSGHTAGFFAAQKAMNST